RRDHPPETPRHDHQGGTTPLKPPAATPRTASRRGAIRQADRDNRRMPSGGVARGGRRGVSRQECAPWRPALSRTRASDRPPTHPAHQRGPPPPNPPAATPLTASGRGPVRKADRDNRRLSSGGFGWGGRRGFSRQNCALWRAILSRKRASDRPPTHHPAPSTTPSPRAAGPVNPTDRP